MDKLHCQFPSRTCCAMVFTEPQTVMGSSQTCSSLVLEANLALSMRDYLKSHGFMNHRAPANGRYKPTCYEHAANCYTHAFLIVPAIVGSALLHRLSDDCWEKITAWIYGMGLCALFIVSTVFHIVSWKKSHLRTVEHCFHMCDRMVIYFFIAASYAPWLNLRELGPLASHMRWFIWLMAAGGTIYVFLYHEKYKVVELFFYLTMGFSPALVVTSMNNTDGLHELACGGLIYCLGVVFFKSDGIIPFAHAIWHLFVATAAAECDALHSSASFC
uniref:Monocyte to macrophage differentiation associated n=1 Tax=Felis catus TaxID=9685 RepID=A0ABI7ZVD0_FELCA